MNNTFIISYIQALNIPIINYSNADISLNISTYIKYTTPSVALFFSVFIITNY